MELERQVFWRSVEMPEARALSAALTPQPAAAAPFKASGIGTFGFGWTSRWRWPPTWKEQEVVYRRGQGALQQGAGGGVLAGFVGGVPQQEVGGRLHLGLLPGAPQFGAHQHGVGGFHAQQGAPALGHPLQGVCGHGGGCGQGAQQDKGWVSPSRGAAPGGLPGVVEAMVASQWTWRWWWSWWSSWCRPLASGYGGGATRWFLEGIMGLAEVVFLVVPLEKWDIKEVVLKGS